MNWTLSFNSTIMPGNTEKKTINDLLLLGDPRLYEKCESVTREELYLVSGWVSDLHDVMEDIRATYHFGRGIAAPQLGIMKRLFYINVDAPLVVINPEVIYESQETFELWDDCMSFPDLLVKVRRHRQFGISYKDENWQERRWIAENDMAELVQHEYDHLNGILCTMRAIDGKSFKWKKH